MFTSNNYVKVKSLDEAWELNQKRSNKIAGGMLWLKMSDLHYNTLIDLSGLGLDKIIETEEEISIGCMVSLRQLERDKGLDSYSRGAVREAMRFIVGVQFRNMATVGGSLYGRYGFSDVLTVFMAMDSFVELHRGGVIPLREFAQMKPDRDILVRLIIKKTPMSFFYQSVKNTKTDFPVLTCAAASSNGRIRLAIGARPAKAVIFEDSMDVSASDFAKKAASSIETGSNMRGSAEYRSHLVEVLAKRAYIRLGGED